MVWLLLLLGMAFLIFLIARMSPAPTRRRRHDHGGSGVVMLDDAPLIGPETTGMGVAAGAMPFDAEEEDSKRFQPGGGTGGGGGASGSWDEDEEDFADEEADPADDDGWDDGGSGNGGDGGDD